ncbi:MAG: hypothetical protein ACM3ZV_08010 [Bacillota bacterium]
MRDGLTNVRRSLEAPVTFEEREFLEQMAAKCRRLADAISDGPTRESLLRLGDEYERQAVGSGQMLPLQTGMTKGIL